MKFLTILTFLLYYFAIETTAYRLRLNGEDWVWSGKGVQPFNGTVPGDVYTDLHKAGLIPDPYLNFNDVNLRWVSKQSWSISKSFTTEHNPKADRVFLVIKGLDTVADVYINNALVLSNNNMFHEHVLDISEKLRGSGTNQIRVDFVSPVTYAANQSSSYAKSKGYSVPPDCPPPTQSPECHVNFIRKMASSFSWDWGPAFPTMGIWKNLWVEITPSCFINDFSGVPVYQATSNSWIIHAEAIIWCAQEEISSHLELSLPELRNVGPWNSTVNLTAGPNRVYESVMLHASVVERWWPSGYGEQKLYVFEAQLRNSNSRSSKTVRLGFRDVQLIQKPMVNGNSFYLTVNSIPVFLKGSNWIPTDAFLSTVTKDKLKFFFSSMKAANMNALRVWGGGVYESDDFYDLADEYGILIWQDFMFAVNLYPTDSAFLASVSKEAEDQLFRIKKHPSIGIWAGNNENELGLVGNWYHTTGQPASQEQYRRDYMTLYNATIWRVVNASDYGSRPFVLSSPSNGIDTIRQGGIASNAGSDQYGDIHYYNYAADAWTPSTFPIPRCATEFGYQSMPAFETLTTAIPNSIDWQYFSRAVLHRQHHPFGNIEMLASVLQHFPIPHCNSGQTPGAPGSFMGQSYQSFVDVCSSPMEASPKQEEQFLRDISYLSQLHQAMAYKTEVEHYRRWRNRTQQGTGLGNTMCALYWQLNDIWQAPSWSSIDYSLKWKPAHYYARKFFAPLLVSPYIDGEDLVIFTVSDSLDPIRNVTLHVEGFRGDLDFQPKAHRMLRIPIIEPLSSNQEMRIPIGLFFNTPRTPDSYIIRTSLTQRYTSGLTNSDGASAAPDNTVFPTKIMNPKGYGKVKIVAVRLSAAHTFQVTVSSTGPALFVWLEAGSIQGWWSDNAFTLTSNNTQVQFYPWSLQTTLAEFKTALTIKSILDLYD